MLTTELLTDLVRRYVLVKGERIVWSRGFADGPAVYLETTGRLYDVRVVRDRLLVEQAPWVAAVAAATVEDGVVHDPPLRDHFLVQRDGAVVWLNDPRAVAALGPRLHRGELDPAAYAELLVVCQWPGGWDARLVRDPAAWRGSYPAQADPPPVQPLRAFREGGTLHLRFSGSRETVHALGGRRVLEVAAWSVRVPAGEPATWETYPVADAVPLQPPW